MSKILLRIADLRKKSRMMQQELADSIGVSFQTISKWETGISMPDITVLPLLAEFFSVSTDQLLGLKPLNGETYIPEKTSDKDFWNQKLEYLLRTRKNYWNDDYAHRSGRLINRYPCWIAAADMDFWEHLCCLTCQREALIRELTLRKI